MSTYQGALKIVKKNESWARSLQSIRQFFRSHVRWTAISWLALLLTLLLTASSLNVVNSYVGRDFMTAVSRKDWRGFFHFAALYLIVFALQTMMAVFSRFSEERLRLLWRGWLTRRLIDLYMSGDRFYRLKAYEELDNPDERITEDVKSYTQTTLSFFLMSLNAVITSLAFLGVLWSITPWLVLAAVTYASMGSAMTILVGRSLVRLNNLQLQKEADLRYNLIQTRETAEAIATMEASRTVRDCLRGRLADVVGNQKRIIGVNRNLGFFTQGYNYVMQILPLLIVAPLYINGRVEFGVVTQSAMAFTAFLNGFSLIVTQFETLSSFATVTMRLGTIAEALDQARMPKPPAGIHIEHDDDRVAYEGLSLRSIEGHRPLINDLTLEVVYGSNLLITGPDTGAEEALFMATAGYWDHGTGRIVRPRPQAMDFVPTEPLAVRCTIRSQLAASCTDRQFPDRQMMAVLEKLGLDEAVRRVGGLDADVHSPSALSLTEQRLLVFARVLLAPPRFVLLDRIAAVLNHEQLLNVYRLLREAEISALSIGNSPVLEAYHDRVLVISGEGRWHVRPADTPKSDDGIPTGHPIPDAAGRRS
jgi:vitamin B12/bleomycin/antimicrobial peptide transport system ATP-binding/permease protein